MKESTFRKKLDTLVREYLATNEIPGSLETVTSECIVILGIVTNMAANLAKYADDKVELKNGILLECKKVIFK